MKSRTKAFQRAAIVLFAGLTSACSVSDQEPPPLTGPSGFAQSVTLTASPDRLAPDGTSQSVVTVIVRNETGQPVQGQRLAVRTTAGTLSQSQVTTGGDGRATVVLTAPSASTPTSNNAVELSVTPVDAAGADTSATRTLSIALTGPPNTTAPTPAFTFNPESPTLQQAVVFDASGTQDERVACNDACTYIWDFGGESTATGRVVTYRFQAVRTYPVTLTVRDASGGSATLTQNVSVAEGTPPTAGFTFSPAAPVQLETVFFSAAGSRVGVPGRTITSYEWRFGDGSTGTGVNASHAYSAIGTYPVILTVTDNAGLQSTTTQNVTVANGVTAAFTASPSNPTTADAVVFDAEASRGAGSGVGGTGIVEYIWNFGDPSSPGTVSTSSRIVQHRYPVPRTYTVVLTVVDSGGRRATTSQTLTVSAP